MSELNLYAMLVLVGIYLLIRAFMAGANLAGEE